MKNRHVLVAGSEDGSVCVWDLQTQKLIGQKSVVDGASCINIDYHDGIDQCAVSGNLQSFQTFKVMDIVKLA